jgi:hypothetical protein
MSQILSSLQKLDYLNSILGNVGAAFIALQQNYGFLDFFLPNEVD